MQVHVGRRTRRSTVDAHTRDTVHITDARRRDRRTTHTVHGSGRADGLWQNPKSFYLFVSSHDPRAFVYALRPYHSGALLTTPYSGMQGTVASIS